MTTPGAIAQTGTAVEKIDCGDMESTEKRSMPRFARPPARSIASRSSPLAGLAAVLRVLGVSVVEPLCNCSASAPPARRRRAGLALALLLASALPLATCGKKSEPSPPPEAAKVYPRIYPHE